MSKISELSDGGSLQSTDYLIAVRSGGNVKVQPNGTVTGTTGSFSGNVTFADNAKAIFGAGSDLQIYHDGSNSYIDDAGTGLLRLRSNTIYLEKYTGELLADFNADGYVSLLHDNSEKVRTTSSGIDVTGTVTADGLTVDGTGAEVISVNSTANGSQINFSSATTSTDWSVGVANDATDDFLIYQALAGSGDIKLYTDGKERVEVNNNGDISFYEDTGTTPKFFWDASAEQLKLTGDGTSINVVGATQSIAGGNSNVKIGSSDTAAADKGGQLNFTANTTSSANYPVAGVHGYHETLGAGNYSGYLSLFTTSSGGAITERMRIDSSGRVGIGSTPVAKLDVNGNVFVRGDNAGLVIDSPSSQLMRITTNSSLDQLSFGSGNLAEAMRIDSSGNLLVGTASEATWTTTAGFRTRQSGSTTITRSAAPVLYANRLTSDGAIQEFLKDGTTVGSIGSHLGAYLYIASANNVSGIGFYNNSVRPVDSNGSASDADQDLGASTIRWKDLYLSGYVKTPAGGGIRSDGALYLQSDASGTTKSAYLNTNGDFVFGTSTQGIYLGGTSSANKLDDYETGTFTPTVYAADNTTVLTSGVDYQLNDARYKKVGGIVFIELRIRDIRTTKTNFWATLPFSTASNDSAVGVDAEGYTIYINIGRVEFRKSTGQYAYACFTYDTAD